MDPPSGYDCACACACAEDDFSLPPIFLNCLATFTFHVFLSLDDVATPLNTAEKVQI